MQMFETFLSSIPKNRSELVEELELPEVTVSPDVWETDDYLSLRSDSLTTSTEDGDIMSMTYSTDSSIPLSRAMTDSDIDYGRFRRYKTRSVCDPWDQMKIALDAFPPGYIERLNSFDVLADGTELPPMAPVPKYSRLERRRHVEELKQGMEAFFQRCEVFAPDDPGLEALEDALLDVDMEKIIESEQDGNKTPQGNETHFS